MNWKKLGDGKVYTARNGRTALECMAEHEPDIMITDIQMPETYFGRSADEKAYGMLALYGGQGEGLVRGIAELADFYRISLNKGRRILHQHFHCAAVSIWIWTCEKIFL